jgi:hypothetical protein
MSYYALRARSSACSKATPSGVPPLSRFAFRKATASRTASDSACVALAKPAASGVARSGAKMANSSEE